MFSSRVPEDLAPNRLARARASATVRFDLTVSNPTAVGLPYPEGLLDALADRAGLAYRPDPRGLLSAREAVAGELRRHGVEADPGRIVLTASTSEAYAFLFKVLCDPGQAVLAPSPSYPLIEHLARVEGVEAAPYRLDAEHGWRLDVEEIAAAPETARAAVVVHPNNPTGSHVHPEDAAALTRLCRERGWALIADEVFLDFALDEPRTASFAAGTGCLTFTLGGLSKSVGLPQAKLSWIAVSGPDEAVAPALERLEFVADTFLSVSTAVQLGLPRLLREGEAVREAIRARCRANLAALRALVAAVPAVEALPVGGGWSAVLRVPAVVGEEELALELLREDGVAVQPGYFFDFARDGYLVVSLLTPPEGFRSGVERVLARLRRHFAG